VVMAALDSNLAYMQRVIDWQPRLYGFVLSLLADRNEADDVLQNVNLVLLRKQESFQGGSDFGGWAMQIAYLEVQTHRKRNSRARQRLSDVAVEFLTETARTVDGGWEAHREALRKCLDLVPEKQRELLACRYGGQTMESLSAQLGRPIGSISQSLYRIRNRLADCIRRRLTLESHAGEMP
jgi:RNA polymerase sigma-70 factor, ECF subfamily